MEKSREEILSKKYVGNKYGRLKVLKVWRHPYGKNQMGTFCKAICDCGNIVKDVNIRGLVSGHSQSCGCYFKEAVRKANKRYNDYYIKDDYVVVKTKNNPELEILVDLDIWEELKGFSWWISKQGYASTSFYPPRQNVFLHHFVLEKMQNVGLDVDHINGNRLDNRKKNLRYAERYQNSHNRKELDEKNTSGFTGVGKYTLTKKTKWFAFIRINKEYNFLGLYKTKKEAVMARLYGEKNLLGDFAPQRHLFEEYGI